MKFLFAFPGSLFVFACSNLCAAALVLDGAAPPNRIAQTLKEQLEQIRAKHNLPALAAIMMRDGKIVAIASTGVRKLGSDVPVTDDDEWHIGSCTKSMTATLAAMRRGN